MSTHPDTLRWIARACLAPSSHNAQPWLFRVAGDEIELLADRTRALPVNDPHDRELLISCGCALMGLRVAIAADGRAADVRPAAGEGDLLAQVRASPGAPDTALARLGPALEARHTFRGDLRPGPPDSAVLQTLREAAAAEGADLHFVGEGELRQRLADLVARGDTAQWDDPRWRRELAAWMHPRRRGDGLTVPAAVAPVARRVVGAVDLGPMVRGRDRAMVLEAPLLAILTTRGDSPGDWVTAGCALQRVLLEACGVGLQAAYFNQPLQVVDLREELADLMDAWPQVVFRLGAPAAAGVRTPRRAVSDVLA